MPFTQHGADRAGDARIREAEHGCWRIAVIGSLALIEDIDEGQRQRAARREEQWVIESELLWDRVVAAIAALVSHHQLDMFAKAQRAIDRDRVDGGDVVGLGDEVVGVGGSERRVLDRDRSEVLGLAWHPRSPTSAAELHRDIFKPCLAGRYSPRLIAFVCAGGAIEVGLTLPAIVGELVIIPYRDERPARARRLDIRIGEKDTVQRSIVFDGDGKGDASAGPATGGKRRDRTLLAIAVTEHDWIEVVVDGRLEAVGAGLVDHVAEMDDRMKLVGGGPGVIVDDHLPIGTVVSGAVVLARHPRQVDLNVGAGLRSRASSAADRVLTGDEPIEIGSSRRQAGDQHPHGMIARLHGKDLLVYDQRGKAFVAGDLKLHRHRSERAAVIAADHHASPQHDRGRTRIA